MRQPQSSRRLGGPVSALLVLAALLVGATSAGAAPSGAITAVTSARVGAAPGGTLPLKVTVRATGGRLAARITVRLTTGKRVVALKGVTTARVSGRKVVMVAATLPKRLTPGLYRVTACLSPAPRAGACRALRRQVDVFTFRTRGRKPLTLQRTLDRARSVTTEIGPQGGRVESVSADGSRAVLTIPAGALTIATPITLTPETALDGHPQKVGLLAGVSIEPDGTQLLKPATLELQPARATAPIQRVVLSGDGAGGDSHAEPFRDAGQGARVDLLHFSSYELTFLAASDHAGQLAILDWKKYPPAETDFEGLRAELARQLLTERQKQLLGQGGALPDLVAPLQAYFDQVVKPKLIQAKTNCQVAPVAVLDAFIWARQVQLIGATQELAPELAFYSSALGEIIEEGLECLDRRCTVLGFPEASIDILAMHRIAQLTGITARSSLSETLARCLRFQVELDSEVRVRYEGSSGFGGPDSGGFAIVVHGEQLTAPFDLFTGKFEPVDLTIGYVGVTGRRDGGFNSGNCSGSFSVTPRGGTAGIVRVRFEELHINNTVVAPRPRRLQDEPTFLTLGVESGDPFTVTSGPFETYFYDTSGINCPYVPIPSGNADENLWARIFSYAHGDELADRDVNYFLRIQNFIRGTNPIFLTTSYVREGAYGAIPYSEITTLRLRHVPIAPPPKTP